MRMNFRELSSERPLSDMGLVLLAQRSQISRLNEFAVVSPSDSGVFILVSNVGNFLFQLVTIATSLAP
jgi:hypothetical protein